jgi:hypothetical protein
MWLKLSADSVTADYRWAGRRIFEVGGDGSASFLTVLFTYRPIAVHRKREGRGHEGREWRQEKEERAGKMRAQLCNIPLSPSSS